MNSLRPERLDQFIGQPQAVSILKVLLSAARKRNDPIGHILLVGSPGLGKTSLARAIAHECGSRLVEIVGSAITSSKELTQVVLSVPERGVVFIDEIHCLRRYEETLYPVLEDGVIAEDTNEFGSLMKQLGLDSLKKAKTLRKLPPMTIIGATTMPGLLSSPLRARFGQSIHLEPYNLDDLDRILSAAVGKLDFALSGEMVRAISVRSRQTARTAVNHLLWVRDYLMSNGHKPTLKAVEEAFTLQGVDKYGLTKSDRMLLRLLAATDRPMGLDFMATSLGENEETVASMESYLVQEGFVCRTPRGRVIGAKGRELLQVAAGVST